MSAALLSRWLLLGEWRAHRWQCLVAILAIMLGVALGFSVHLINTAAVSEFSAATKSLSGVSDLTVQATQATFDESLYPQLMQTDGVAAASPVLEIMAGVPAKADGRDDPALKILGLDVFRAATITPDLLGIPAEDQPFDTLSEDAIFLSPAAMKWLAVRPGDALQLSLGTKTVSLRVAGGLARAHAGQRLAVMDVGAAQWHFDHVGLLSRIELKLRPGVQHAAFKEALARELGAAYLLMEGRDQDARIRNMSRAYRVNLNILAMVALLTGAFLIFSGQVLSIIRRRAQFSLLRVLGMTRRQILQQILLEGGLLGVLGSLLGLLLGYAMAAGALRFYGADLGAGFFTSLAPSLPLNPLAALLFFAMGVGVTILGSLAPAWEAAHTHPGPALKSGSEFVALRALRMPWLAGLCLLLAGVLTQLPPVFELPVFGYLAVVLLLVGGIAALPYLASLSFSTLLRGVDAQGRGVLRTLILARLSNASSLAAIALGGVLASFSLMVAMAIMVASFRVSVDNWLAHVLPADIYVRTMIHQDLRGLTPAEQQMIAALGGIERIDFMRSKSLLLDSARPAVTLIARPIDTRDPANTLPMTSDALPPAQMAATAIPIWVSEAMVDLYAFETGKKVTLPLTDPPQTFLVAGIWRDYGRQFGAIQMQLSDYRALTGDQHVSDAALWLASGMTAEQLITALDDLPFGTSLALSQSNQIRQRSLELFDRSFAITYLLELIAIGVGLLGVAASFSAQTLTRIKEFGMLRHIGLSRRQIRRMLGWEGGLLAGFGITLGFVLGVAISLILIFIVNPQSFHWTMQLYMPWTWLSLMALAMLGAAAMTAFAAGRRAVAGNVTQAVKEDW
ncbi:MAG: FtsX-like permease family protein [Nitrosomonas halophila]